MRVEVDQNLPHEVAVVERLGQFLDQRDPVGQLWIVDETRVRVRP